MSILKNLTEGLVHRNLQVEGAAMVAKWEKTGLLEGLNDYDRKNIAVLLENQAKELLRESTSMAAGDVEGFASVAFPIVRRVFGKLIANKLVSVQTMDLPSGLIFFLDFTYSDQTTAERNGYDQGDSLYGGGVVASQLTGGVSDLTEEGGGFYNLAGGYSSPTGSWAVSEVTDVTPASMSDNEISDELDGSATALITTGTAVSALTDAQKKSIRYDPDVLGSTSTNLVGILVAKLSAANMAQVSFEKMTTLVPFDGTAPDALGGATVVRRLTERGYRDTNGNLVANSKNQYISFYVTAPAGSTIEVASSAPTIKGAIKDSLTAGGGLGSVVGTNPWALEGASNTDPTLFEGRSVNQIPEIDIKVDSVTIQAETKKLKAKWTQELSQDLSAYHNVDAEVELTGIISEQIGLELDRETLQDLVKGGTAGTYYWSRRPGRFVDRATGADISTFSNEALLGADFTGTVSEWYETLVETVNDISAQIHRKTLRGGANFLVVSPEVANILEFTSGFRADVTHDVDNGSVGAVKVGQLSKKWDVYVDPYFYRNVILVGRKGQSFLESGYVFAPYVPLQLTPVIWGTEDFLPRRGAITRNGRKMVRPDMYGLVIVKDFTG